MISNWRRPSFLGTAWANSSKKKRSEEHTSELQSQSNLVCRLLLEKKQIIQTEHYIRLEGDLRWVSQPHNTQILHLHVGVKGPDRDVGVSDWLRKITPTRGGLSAN